MSVTLITNHKETVAPLRWAWVDTAWGYLVFVCRGGDLCRLFLPRKKKKLLLNAIQSEFAAAELFHGLLPDLQTALRKYFEGGKAVFNCRIDISWAGDFAQAVLRECVKLKAGHTVTYGDLARRVGRGGAARAVGVVMKSNRVPLIVPCHRVVAADGSLGGYSAPGGAALKKRLLEHEKKIFLNMGIPEQNP